ncbi:MAG: CRISPR-associated endonuclease Cas1 [Cenarchaeum sp. SB0661_bin_35]|nr:CRISPR-associated endonuclease Cas1 [Cenarchaeum sp. SB0667_bin_13]MYC80455.1 CRISPR-associated endonuclease Cas1 [Cenarchaeum sp. SB0661_bin_35]
MSIVDSNSGLIPVRMLTQYSYCPRLAYMEWVQGEFAYSADVVEGTQKHKNVDTPAKKSTDTSQDTIHAKSVLVSDEKLGIIAKIDVMDISENVAIPIEYKRGRTPENSTNAWEDHMIQLCAQGLLLRKSNYACTEGVIYYVTSKQRITIKFDDILVAKTLQTIYDIKEMLRQQKIPPPLVNSPKCPRCSLVGICLPDETSLLMPGATTVRKDQVRRLYPIRNDAVSVYVQEQGAYVSLSGDNIIVKRQSGDKQKIRLIDVSALVLFGNVQASTQAIRTLCNRSIPICYLSYGGWFYGMTNGSTSRNVDLRIHQHKTYESKSLLLSIAREIVSGKIKNCMTLLRRNGRPQPKSVLDQMSLLARKSKITKNYNTLLGVEGMAAHHYFGAFQTMLRGDINTFYFNERNRRPPKDPVNTILSFLYALLVREMTTTVSMVGFDVYLGFLHTPHHGRPSLALDLIEEFRPLVADSVCISIINNNVVSKSDFVITPFGVNLNADGRRKVIEAFENRLNSTIYHKLLGYSASYRRIMETQARLLARHISGEIPAYPPFRTR